MPKSLKTNASVWTKVFRRLVQQLENDPDIRRVVGVDNIRSWKGIPGDSAAFAPQAGKAIMRLSPQPRHVDWYSPDSQSGHLVVIVELAVGSLAIDDVNDLYDLVVNALRPGNGTLALDLVAQGAETGEIVFDDPAFDPHPEADPQGTFYAVGQFQLNVLRSVNP
jgi:hypothetical protein